MYTGMRGVAPIVISPKNESHSKRVRALASRKIVGAAQCRSLDHAARMSRHTRGLRPDLGGNTVGVRVKRTAPHAHLTEDFGDEARLALGRHRLLQQRHVREHLRVSCGGWKGEGENRSLSRWTVTQRALGRARPRTHTPFGKRESTSKAGRGRDFSTISRTSSSLGGGLVSSFAFAAASSFFFCAPSSFISTSAPMARKPLSSVARLL